MTLHDFVDAAVAYCQATGASVTSWGRTRAHNTQVGGQPYSPHRFWRGVDVVYDEPVPAEERIETARRLGLFLYAEGDHDHLQPRDWTKG